MKAICTLLSFIVILWNLSGPFVVSILGKEISIPGYMVWVAICYAGLGTFLIHKVGHRLVNLNFVQQRYEADFRFSMMRLRENAESVAFYHGEPHEKSVFLERFRVLLENFWKIVKKQKQLVWLNSGYSQIAIIFPFVVAIPRYLRRELTLGGLMQVATAFGRVQDSLSYFVDAYATLAEWQAVVDRLTSFRTHLEAAGMTKTQNQVTRMVGDEGRLVLDQFEVDLPSGSPILKPLTMTVQAGTHILIRGTSGSGKSTFLRALAGIWPFAKGKANHLDEEADWTHVFSVGEQQRLAFVRALIYEPAWLFMDESTSALDEETEKAMYELLLSRLARTTLISVGHRGSTYFT